MSFQDIRDNAEKFPTALWMSQKARGAITRRLTDALKVAGLPSSRRRRMRLLLASEIYERPITSFNDLKDDELWALDQWVLGGQAKKDLPGWLRRQT